METEKNQKIYSPFGFILYNTIYWLARATKTNGVDKFCGNCFKLNPTKERWSWSKSFSGCFPWMCRVCLPVVWKWPHSINCTPSILTGHSSILQRRIELPQEEGSDTSVVPRRRDFNYLYTRTQFCKETLGGVGGGGGFDVLKTCGKSSCSLRKRILKQPQVTKYPGQIYEGDNIPLTIAIATPLMKCVHEKHRTRSSDMPVNFFTWTARSSYVFLYYLLTF